MILDTVDLGASGLLGSGVPWATSKGAPVDDDEAPDYGKNPVAFGLGIAARPYRQNKEGFAVGFSAEAPGYDGVLVGGFDPRTADNYGNLGEGETAVFATGKDFNSRLILKDRNASIVVDDDMIVEVNGKKKSVMINTPGGSMHISKDGGATLVDETGKAMIQLKGGNVIITGNLVLGGRAPVAPVADSLLVYAELAKISAAITLLDAGSPAAYPPPPPTPGVGAAGIFVGK